MKRHQISKSKFHLHRKDSFSDLNPGIIFNPALDNFAYKMQVGDINEVMNRSFIYEDDISRRQTLDILKKLALADGFVKTTIETSYPECNLDALIYNYLTEKFLPIVIKIKKNYNLMIITGKKKEI